eukprot:3064182-Rhodomonas_salina.1
MENWHSTSKSAAEKQDNLNPLQKVTKLYSKNNAGFFLLGMGRQPGQGAIQPEPNRYKKKSSMISDHKLEANNLNSDTVTGIAVTVPDHEHDDHNSHCDCDSDLAP